MITGTNIFHLEDNRDSSSDCTDKPISNVVSVQKGDMEAQSDSDDNNRRVTLRRSSRIITQPDRLTYDVLGLPKVCQIPTVYTVVGKKDFSEKTVQDEFLLQERSEPKIISDSSSDVSSEDLPSDPDVTIQGENILQGRSEPKLVSDYRSDVSLRISQGDRYFPSVRTDRSMSDSGSKFVKSAASRRVPKFISHPYSSTYDVLGAPKVSQIYNVAKYKFADNVSVVSEFKQLKSVQSLLREGLLEYRRAFPLVVDISEPTGTVRPKSDSFCTDSSSDISLEVSCSRDDISSVNTVISDCKSTSSAHVETSSNETANSVLDSIHDDDELADDNWEICKVMARLVSEVEERAMVEPGIPNISFPSDSKSETMNTVSQNTDYLVHEDTESGGALRVHKDALQYLDLDYLNGALGFSPSS